MRGARGRVGIDHEGPGIIPAYAGSTDLAQRSAEAARDHPRVCGEHHVPFTPVLDGRGSSPRMRGAPACLIQAGGFLGIIPAYAGSTRQAPCRCPPRRDHPRVCGEHATICHALPHLTGSSPRMRGALRPPLADDVDGGIIPAYAGSTPRPRRWARRPRDHPRVCGEHRWRARFARAGAGSSPRMRGAHFTSCDSVRHSDATQSLFASPCRPAPPRSFNISQRCPRLYPGSSL